MALVAPRPCPDLNEAHQHLAGVLKLLTEISLASMAELVPDGTDDGSILEEHLQRMSMLCAQVRVDAAKMNPRWNKTYGAGGTCWTGALEDGRERGGIPYFCADGWTRFALNVCPDDDFEKMYKDWGYLYHGTKGKFVGSILTSGFRSSKALCYCGENDEAVYMSPSVEYCGHPRYGSIEFNPETRRWVQIVLQCRVNPRLVWQKCPETMRCKAFDLRVDPNIDNSEMEWLFKPNFTDAQTGQRFIKDAIVCTGIMMRISDRHPLDLPHWWSMKPDYAKSWNLSRYRVDPMLKPCLCRQVCALRGWQKVSRTEMETYTLEGDALASSRRTLGHSYLSPHAFGSGHMRLAWILHAYEGVFAVKKYNAETLTFINDVLGCSEEEAFMKDARTYLEAQRFAGLFNEEHDDPTWKVRFVRPLKFCLDGAVYFGEEYIKGHLVKWNSNIGEVNDAHEANDNHVMGRLAETFSHYTFVKSQGRMMVVDIQGWRTDDQGIVFTDPQIHTRQFDATAKSRKDDTVYKRFSVGNLGRTGIVKFFMNHTCNRSCKSFGLSSQLERNLEISVPIATSGIVVEKPAYSPEKSFGGVPMKLQVYAQEGAVGAYVMPAIRDPKPGWTVPEVKFTITFINALPDRSPISRTTTCTFSETCKSYGWKNFLSTSDLTIENGWINSKGNLHVIASIEV